MGNLRLSVTDRCNLRCQYCMPEADYLWLRREDLLTFEELARVARVFASQGVRRVRLTGGEPLLRRDLHELVRKLLAIAELEEVALTTNGLLLAPQASALKTAGLSRLTVSLDTLRPERFLELAKRDELSRVLDGIEAARREGFPLKLDSVLLRGTNDDEIGELLDFARGLGAELRFIEYMDVGGATQWSPQRVVSRREILEQVSARFGEVRPIAERGAAPAERFALLDGTIFGIVASVTVPFCRACDRSRVTADGTWFKCLYAKEGVDLRTALREGASDEQLASLLAQGWRMRDDRGAEQRRELSSRGPLVDAHSLRGDPRLEMHTRGG